MKEVHLLNPIYSVRSSSETDNKLRFDRLGTQCSAAPPIPMWHPDLMVTQILMILLGTLTAMECLRSRRFTFVFGNCDALFEVASLEFVTASVPRPLL